MTSATPRDPDFQVVVTKTFRSQSLMATLGARLVRVEPGLVEIELPVTGAVSQQAGSVHAGAIAAIADAAAGLAALSLMEPGSDVVSVEFKLNLLAPAVGSALVANARVIRGGRNLTVCSTDVVADGKLVAVFQGTMMRRSMPGSRGTAELSSAS